MSNKSDTFFTSIGCMDGRVQAPIARFGQEKFDVKYPDTLTEAGLVGRLAEAKIDPNLKESIKFKSFDVSVGKHHSKGIIVHGHQHCAGNPVDDDLHRKQALKSAEFVRSFVKDIPVIPVFVEKIDEDWVVKEL